MTITFLPHQQKALDVMKNEDVGQIIVPTGGGKTMIMMEDLLRDIDYSYGQPTVSIVVAPRLLLSQQLCDDFTEHCRNRKNFNKNQIQIVNVHSGKGSKFFTTTKPRDIKDVVRFNLLNERHTVLFTTYHSLHRIVECNMRVHNVYYDESHNSTAKSFYTSVEAMANRSNRR